MARLSSWNPTKADTSLAAFAARPAFLLVVIATVRVPAMLRDQHDKNGKPIIPCKRDTK
jgi:hypothetical protein